ncbi:MAG: cytochrome c [Gammaproteobacteria bacterium]
MIRMMRRQWWSIRRLRVRAFLLMAGLLLGAAVAQSAEPVSPKLTPKLRDLLRQEMVSVNQASQQILAALVTGDDDHVATLAQQIHDSFIMNQSMTEADEAALLAAVPEAFVQQDEAFHELAAALAGAARAGDRPQQQKHFSQMIEACTACHATYATDRFPHFTR